MVARRFLVPLLGLALVACDYPEEARAPQTRLGPAPGLAPIAPLVADLPEPDRRADRQLQNRAGQLRRRANRIPAGERQAERLIDRADSLRGRADDLRVQAIDDATREAMEAVGDR
jgi:hypothetical protein